MPIELSDKEIEIVRSLLRDWGFEYSLETKQADVLHMARRLKMPPEFIRDFET